MIINEVVTNPVKHAYGDGRGGTLAVSAKERGGRAVIRIVDDRQGMADPGALVDGLNRTLTARLSRQVGAATTWERANPGTSVTIDIPAGA